VEFLHLWPLSDQHDAHRLLLTAAASQHAHRLLLDVLSCDCVQQHINTAAQEAVIMQLLAHESDLREEVTLSMLTGWQLFELQPAAVQLTREIVARLLLAELQKGSFAFVQYMLEENPGAWRAIAGGHVESMLLAALQGASQQRTDGLRSARLLSKRGAKLARVAAAKRVQSCVRKLCKLPGAAEISSTAVAGLLQAALQLQDWGSVKTVAALCKLPAAAGISAKELLQLLQAAAAQRRVWNTASGAALNSLHSVVAARHQHSADAAELIAAAVECGAGAALSELCKLPAMQELSSAAVVPALEAALKAGSCLCTGVKKLCKLRGAQQLSSEAVVQLLQAAASHKDCDCCMLLLSLPAPRAAAHQHRSRILEENICRFKQHGNIAASGVV
jgi:hypothetical protein